MGFLSDNAHPGAADHHRWFERHFGHGFGVFAIGDDLPHPDNRITLSDDRAGPGRRAGRRAALPAARQRQEDDALHARPAGRDRQGRRRLRVSAAGLYRRGRRLPHPRLASPRHRADGQDDPTCRWSTNGTSAGTCPTSTSSTAASSPPAAWSTRRRTVCALALRAAEHLRDNFRELRATTRPLAA